MAERRRWQRIAKRVRVPLGFVFAAIYLWRAHPTGLTLAASVPLVLGGLALRAYASGYVRKNAELATSGPYAYTRNPLYLGSLLIAFGFGAASGSSLLLILLAALFAGIYLPTILAEEDYLRDHFAQFEQYARLVPRLLPRFIGASGIGERGSFSRALYLQHREYNALLGSGGIYLVLLTRLIVARVR